MYPFKSKAVQCWHCGANSSVVTLFTKMPECPLLCDRCVFSGSDELAEAIARSNREPVSFTNRSQVEWEPGSFTLGDDFQWKHDPCGETVVETTLSEHECPKMSQPRHVHLDLTVDEMSHSDAWRDIREWKWRPLIDSKEVVSVQPMSQVQDECKCSARDLLTFGHRCGRKAPIDR